MKMIEIQSAVDRQGSYHSASLLRDMGLAAGDTVKLAYISNAPILSAIPSRICHHPDGITAR